jgi:hypothetical protein
VSAVTLEEDAVVSSTLSDAGGVLRAFELRSEQGPVRGRRPGVGGGEGRGTTRPAAAPLALSADGDGG